LNPSSIDAEDVTRLPFRGGPAQVDSHGAISQQGAPHGATINNTESSKLLPWLMVCALLSGLAVGLAVLAVILGQQSEREARLAQYDFQILRAKVEAAGIKTDDH
jgi:hypothetical protein